ncbi:hypothetical protein NliqN6_4767 [Naganishia liquefaciens]|uniref:Uncharacterized protein n=1 Tax=Naganishia liquefaciens TaxID=104408 RepID=A0A8H3TX08_9TREE|nr:hypothetical protein NliqN6_4767 [Naganishia liquefaciens]
MEGLIDNAKKFMASEEGQKMQAKFEQQGGADIDDFLGKNTASSSGDNVNFQQSAGDGSNQYSAGQQGRSDAAFSGDVSEAKVREQDNDYSGYGGEDSTAEGGWGANKGGDSFSRQNQLGAENNDSGDASGRTGNNDTNYDGGRALDASGTSTPAYRQEDDDYENSGDNGSSGKTQVGGSYGYVCRRV